MTSNLLSDLVGSETTTILTPVLSSISFTLGLLSFKRKIDISGETTALTSPLLFFADSSSISLSTAVDKLATSCVHLSWREGLSLCRDISIRPNLEILPTWTLALSTDRAVQSLSSTALLFLSESMSIKSITISPPMSLNRSCLAISTADSRFVLTAVSSISLPFVDFAEFISIATSASVWSITIDPPLGRLTSLWYAVSIWLSIW